MPYGLDNYANPVFLVSTMAMHAQNVQADPLSSLLVTQPDAIGDPLGASRVTLLGNILPVSVPEVAEARKLYLARYANSKYWVDFDDFSFYRMDVVDVYCVGGFGVMGWVSASEYSSGQPDPLADTATDIIQHMNTDHGDALVLLAQAFAGIESQEAVMTSVDRLGFHLRLKIQDGTRGARIAFLREVSSPVEARKVLVEMVGQARRTSPTERLSRLPSGRSLIQVWMSGRSYPFERSSRREPLGAPSDRVFIFKSFRTTGRTT
jgi:putative heme iron utilization protein